MKNATISDFPESFIENYLFPLFLAYNYDQLIFRMTVGTCLYGLLTFLLPFAAPYGRYSAKWAGFGVPSRLAWFIQESPSFFVPLFMMYYGRNNDVYGSLTNKVCLGMFVVHYFNRAFYYSYNIKSQKPTPFLPFISAFMTCLYNGILHGMYFVFYCSYDDSDWLSKLNFWFGIGVWYLGMRVNIHSDDILRNLRKGMDREYKIPKGGMFAYVSCANYFGEIVEMWGYALASFAPPALAHALFTTLFLTRRALQHHQWYLKKFDDYPKDRKAVIPFIL